ncbi:hypothetical protein ACSQ67_017273 [Phaseolus vulgaris]
MANHRERDLFSGDGVDPSNGDDFDDSLSVDSAISAGEDDGLTTPDRLTERLTDILVDERDGDLLIQQTNREERFLQWLQALDLQVMGACRADERLKPLLKMSTTCGVAEDPLLAQLTQHFEPSEVGMLARCFCVPLVSIRVGKINKEGIRFCPTLSRKNKEFTATAVWGRLKGLDQGSIFYQPSFWLRKGKSVSSQFVHRGNLTLVLLPSSDLRLSFIGDDGKTERLLTVTNKSQCSSLVVDEIPTDSSGRSFFISAADSRTFYFWCSEKSKLLGIELLGKMKDLLKRKPSIVELSGISKSRLDCFATQLRAFLVGTTGDSSGRDHSVCASTSANSVSCCNVSSESSHPSSSKFPRSRNIGSQTAKADTTLYQSILSPRSSSFKEVPPRNLSSHRIAAREKIKRRGDNHQQMVDNLTNDSTNTSDLSSTSDHDKASEVTQALAFSPSFLGSLGKLGVPSSLGLGGEVTPSVLPLFLPTTVGVPQGFLPVLPLQQLRNPPNLLLKRCLFPQVPLSYQALYQLPC